MADLTTEILIEIRDEVRKTNGRLDQTNERLDRLERRQVEAEVRISTEIVAVVGAVRDLSETLRANLPLVARIGDHERRLLLLEQQRGG